MANDLNACGYLLFSDKAILQIHDHMPYIYMYIYIHKLKMPLYTMDYWYNMVQYATRTILLIIIIYHNYIPDCYGIIINYTNYHGSLHH